MLLGIAKKQIHPTSSFVAAMRRTRSVVIALAQQEDNMSKREKWAEQDIDELPPGENDNFERKSGQLFEKNKGEFLDIIAKALSAFANSGGGHLILGVNDQGIPDGLPQKVGNTSIKDWFEQKIPNLLDYALTVFRVHVVEKAVPSRIPSNSEVVVIDIGDSALAPHQSIRDRKYYYRSAGRSEPAPHFYLELLRQRLTNPALEFSLVKFIPQNTRLLDEGVFLDAELHFRIENVGRIAAYKWGLFIRSINNLPDGRENDYYPYRQNYPVQIPKDRGIRMDDTILPGGVLTERMDFGFLLRPTATTHESLEPEIEVMIANISLGCQLATETSPGQVKQVELRPVINLREIAEFIISNKQ